MIKLINLPSLLLLTNLVLGTQPNIVLVMTDDQGWGPTGYMNHPVLKTPHLDNMASNGLCFKRFYAGGPVCSPTRATVLTGRTHDRTGVFNHGYALRLQEKTISQALKISGYAATSKSTTILNYCNLNKDIIDCIFDTTPEKIGKFSPGMHIPIKNSLNFKNNYPDIAYLFAWNHKDEIFKKEGGFNGEWFSHVSL